MREFHKISGTGARFFLWPSWLQPCFPAVAGPQPRVEDRNTQVVPEVYRTFDGTDRAMSLLLQGSGKKVAAGEANEGNLNKLEVTDMEKETHHRPRAKSDKTGLLGRNLLLREERRGIGDRQRSKHPPVNDFAEHRNRKLRQRDVKGNFRALNAHGDKLSGRKNILNRYLNDDFCLKFDGRLIDKKRKLI